MGLHLLFGLNVVRVVLRADAEQRGLGDVHVALRDQLVHLAVEEAQQQRADVRSVDVGIAHDDDLVVAAFGDVLLFADADADGLDHALDFFVGQHLVFAGFVGVDDLAAQRQNGLEIPQPAAFGAAAGRIALDQVQLAAFHFLADAIAQFAGQAAAAEHGLAFAEHVLGLAGRFAGFGCQDAFADQRLGRLRVLFQVLGQRIANRRVDDAFHLAVAQLGLGLAFELRMRDADAR